MGTHCAAFISKYRLLSLAVVTTHSQCWYMFYMPVWENYFFFWKWKKMLWKFGGSVFHFQFITYFFWEIDYKSKWTNFFFVAWHDSASTWKGFSFFCQLGRIFKEYLHRSECHGDVFLVHSWYKNRATSIELTKKNALRLF